MEYRRLLGYPRGSEPSARALELAAWARAWFARHGRPWLYLREAAVDLTGDSLRIDGRDLVSPQLREHLRQAEATRAVLFVASAGAACETQARQLWQDSKPDEYFFLEMFGSTVVEHLVALANGRVCAQAEAAGFSALPHYSPGYGDWDVAEQNALFDLIRQGAAAAFPEPLEVLRSGMLRPKKSLLGIIGFAPRSNRRHHAPAVPCANCSFSPCQYRRLPYRHAAETVNGHGRRRAPADRRDAREQATEAPVDRPLTSNATYSVNRRALEKWSRERVQIEPGDAGTRVARFRFDGTTCSNMGRPLAFEYRVVLGPPAEQYRIVSAECRPCAGDEGYQHMCEYLRDPEGLMAAIATEPPLVGRPLDDVLRWRRSAVSSGCYCDADSRAHKWGLALEAIHFALAEQQREPAVVSLGSSLVE